MRTTKRPRGFLTFAQNGKLDYLRMAYAMALSLKATQREPYLTVVVTPGTVVPEALPCGVRRGDRCAVDR